VAYLSGELNQATKNGWHKASLQLSGRTDDTQDERKAKTAS
jgi:hypothetical protein